MVEKKQKINKKETVQTKIKEEKKVQKKAQVEFFKLSDNEEMVKTYHCTTFGGTDGDGYLTVTNKRLVYHGYAKNTRIVNEIPIESVSGVNTYFGYGRKVITFMMAIIMSIFSIWSIYQDYYVHKILDTKNVINPITFYAVIAAFTLFLLSRTILFNLSVFSNVSSSTPIKFGADSVIGKRFMQGASMSLVSYPTEETDKMMRELGAVIEDIKHMGDKGIEKWRDNEQTIKSDISIKEIKETVKAEEFF